MSSRNCTRAEDVACQRAIDKKRTLRVMDGVMAGVTASMPEGTESGYKTPEPMKRPSQCPGAPMKKRKLFDNTGYFVPLNTASPSLLPSSPSSTPSSPPLVINMISIENFVALHLNVIYVNPPNEAADETTEVASQLDSVDLDASTN